MPGGGIPIGVGDLEARAGPLYAGITKARNLRFERPWRVDFRKAGR